MDKANQTKVIGVSQCSDDAWRRTMNNEMKREASFNPGVEIKIKTAHDSNQQQIRDIESFIADQVDLHAAGYVLNAGNFSLKGKYDQMPTELMPPIFKVTVCLVKSYRFS